MKLENTFNMQKFKFRTLRELNVGLTYGVDTMIASCALHNFCIHMCEIDKTYYIDVVNIKWWKLGVSEEVQFVDKEESRAREIYKLDMFNFKTG